MGAAGGGKTRWKELADPNTGKHYYVNRETRETSWSKPADFDAPLTSSGTAKAVQQSKGGGGEIKLLWKEVTDKNTGKLYFVNRQTKETSWKRPADFDAPLSGATQASPIVGTQSKSGSGGKTLWKEVTDSNGKRYYVNRQTKETSWKKPPNFDAPLPTANGQGIRPAAGKQGASAGGERFKAHTDAKGRTYRFCWSLLFLECTTFI